MQPAKLYFMQPSHPAHAVRLMLDHKRISYELKHLLPGIHPILIRAHGFRGATVPALEIDGRRLQHSGRIARELDRIQPDRPLFPADPDERAKVEQAERWCDEELQQYSRRILRWAAATQPRVVREMTERARIPAARWTYAVNIPIAWHSAWSRRASTRQVQSDLERLPAALDHVDELIAAGTIGADRPNAATFQIAASTRAFALSKPLWERIEGRPAGRLAREMLPRWMEPLPVEIPAAWLPAEHRERARA